MVIAIQVKQPGVHGLFPVEIVLEPVILLPEVRIRPVYSILTQSPPVLVVPFEVDVEVGTSFGHLTEAKFSNKGNLLNGKEIQSFLQDAQSSCTN